MSVTVTSSTITVDVTTNPITVRTGTLSALWGNISGTLSNQTDLQAALNLKAPLASPTFTGSPVAPTPIPGDNSTLIATTAWVQNEGYLSAAQADLSFQPLSSTLTTLSGFTAPSSALVGISDAQTVSNKTLTTVEKLEFDTASPTVSSVVGGMNWNDTDGTVDLILKGGNVTLQLGQETVQRAYNNSGVAITNGEIVYITGSSGQRLTIAKANANSQATAIGVLGVATEDIGTNSEGFVTVEGLVRNISTSGIAEGTPIYLSASTSGAFTSTKPSLPNYQILIGYVIRGNHPSTGSVFVKVDNQTKVSVGTQYVYSAKTADYTITSTDDIIDCTTGSFTVTLPTAVGISGRAYTIRNSGAGTITLATTSSQTIDGSAPSTLSASSKITVASTGTNWITI